MINYNQSAAIPLANQNIAPLQPYQQYAQQYTQDPNQYQVQQFNTAGYPQTGLAGSEQALGGGLSGALTGLQYGTDQAQNALMNSANQGMGYLNQGFNTAQRYGAGALGALGQANNAAQGYISQGLGDINKSFDSGISALSQFIQPGVNAYNLQGNYLGANGTDAQSQAFANYQAGPEQAYLRQQGERAVLQNARAAGGVGGNVLKELQSQGIGMAAQDYGNYFNRLAGMSGQGLNAASNVGSLRGQQAGLQGQLASQGASTASQFGSNQANILSGLGSMGYDLGSSGANIQGNLGNNLATLLSGAGNRAADYAFNTGGALSAGRTNAGNQIAQLQGNEGVDLSNLIGSSSSNIAQLLSGTGDTINAQQGNLANLLANISTGTGSAAGNQTSVAQFQQNPNYLAQLGQIAGAASSTQDAYNRYQQQQKNQNYYDYNFNGGNAYA